jgi:hypothetical protein
VRLARYSCSAMLMSWPCVLPLPSTLSAPEVLVGPPATLEADSVSRASGSGCCAVPAGEGHKEAKKRVKQQELARVAKVHRPVFRPRHRH